MVDDNKWLVHLGIHKTGTTHIQDQLAQQSDELSRAGISFVPRDAMRQGSLLNLLRKKGTFRFAPRNLRRRKIHRELSTKGFGNCQILISDENVIGSVSDVFAERPYPNLERQLEALLGIVGHRAALFFCVRNPATLLPSAYAQMIRFSRSAQPFATYLENWLNNPPRWSELAQRILTAFPDATITGWSFEHFAANPDSVLEALFPQCQEQSGFFNIPASTQRPTLAAVKKIEALDKKMNRAAYQNAAARLVELHKVGQKFEPLTPEHFARISRHYAEDLKALSAMEIRWLG